MLNYGFTFILVIIANVHILLVLQQCFLATRESNLYILEYLTPAKHVVLGGDSKLEGIPFEDLSAIQLSSSRLRKHIKSD